MAAILLMLCGVLLLIIIILMNSVYASRETISEEWLSKQFDRMELRFNNQWDVIIEMLKSQEAINNRLKGIENASKRDKWRKDKAKSRWRKLREKILKQEAASEVPVGDGTGFDSDDGRTHFKGDECPGGHKRKYTKKHVKWSKTKHKKA